MASKFPNELDELATNSVNNTVAENVHPALHNDANAAINSIEETLGVNPQGDFDTVADRLDDDSTVTRNLVTSILEVPVNEIFEVGQEGTSFLNGWQNAPEEEPPTFSTVTIINEGVFEYSTFIRGEMVNASSTNATIFVLPTRFRPKVKYEDENFIVLTNGEVKPVSPTKTIGGGPEFPSNFTGKKAPIRALETNPFRYYKKDNRVYLSGIGFSPINAVEIEDLIGVFTLPNGYRPKDTPTSFQSGDRGENRLGFIRSNGEVRCLTSIFTTDAENELFGNNAGWKAKGEPIWFTSVDGISFYVE